MIAHCAYVTGANPSAMPPPFAPYNTNVLLAAVAAVSAAIAFVAALHLYARCFLQRRGGGGASSYPRTLPLHRPPDGYEVELEVEAVRVVAVTPSCAPEAAGLDAKELAALPVLVWESSSSADVQEEVAGAQHSCAVCLGEMEDGELGRLLPACGHVFHVGCIDAWLGLSSTCPLCRTAVRSSEDAAVPACPR